MKKISLCLIVLLCAIIVYSSEPIPIAEGITLEVTQDGYIVDFTSPYFEEREAIIESSTNRQFFSQIVYGRDAKTIKEVFDRKKSDAENLNDIFDHLEERGVPELPFYSLTLQLPQRAKFRVEVSEIEFLDIKTGRVSSKAYPHKLKHPYLPCQIFPENEELREIQFAKDAYRSTQPTDLFWTSEPMGYLGTCGFTFCFAPLQYIPSMQAVVPIAHARYTIYISGDASVKETMARYLYGKNSVSEEITGLYDNYKGLELKRSANKNKGKYLIVTIPKYVSTLKTFVTHKQNLGYSVSIKTFPAGTSCDTIRTYLVWRGRQDGEFPKYTLIVGDYSEIPYSDGQLGNYFNPPSDIYYSCLEYYKKSHESNFFPESLTGRWPVSSTLGLNNVIKKTIAFEKKNTIERRISLFSGTGKGQGTFASDIGSAFNKFKKIPRSSVVKYDGRSGFNSRTIRNEFKDYDELLFLYRGHGNFFQLGEPYDSITATKLPVRQAYFAIGLACQLNWPANIAYAEKLHVWCETFGNNWIKVGDRACGMYGASTDSNRGSNTYHLKYIYNYIPNESTNVTWGQWMANAAAKYYNALKNPTRQRQARKYIILGDPSLYIFGINPTNGNPYPYRSYKHVEDFSETSDGSYISPEEVVKSASVYTVLGTLLKQQNTFDSQSVEEVTQSLLTGLQSGTYLIVISTDKNQYTNKIIKH